MAQQQVRYDARGGLGSAPVRVGAVAVLLVLAVVAARARADGDVPQVAGPSGALVIGVIRFLGIAVLTAGLVLLLWGRRIQRVTVAGGPAARPKQLTRVQRNRVILAVLIGTVVALAYQVVLQLVGPPKPQKQQTPEQPGGSPDSTGWIDRTQAHPPGQAGIGTYLTVLVAIVALVALVAVLLRRHQLVEVLSEDGEEPVETVARAVAAGRAAVADRTILDPREAIVACFAAMERALAGVGGDAAPRAADTPQEVLRRGFAGCALPEEPAATLLELFREARFSRHPMDPSDRDSAHRALTAILAAPGIGRERAG